MAHERTRRGCFQPGQARTQRRRIIREGTGTRLTSSTYFLEDEPGQRPHQEFGWLCIGVGQAEFQLEPMPQPQSFVRAIRDFKVDGIDISLLPTFEIAQGRNEPMWDRWIDK